MRSYFSKIFIVTILSVCISISYVHALDIKTYDGSAIDTSIVRSDINYSIPSEIIIAPIFQQDSNINLNPLQRYRGLYYYLIQKMGYSDIPFHYIISDSGEVFQGNASGVERKVDIANQDGSAVIIGYLVGNLESGFDPKAMNALESLLLEIVNNNSIRPNRIKVSKLIFKKNSQDRSVQIQLSDINGNWGKDLEVIKNNIGSKYSPIEKVYSAKAQLADELRKEVTAGEIVRVNLRVKNVGQNGFYGSSDSGIMLERQDGRDSQFFVNNTWLSKSQLPVMNENQNLLPNQEELFEIEIKAPLAYGEISETFELKTLKGNKVESETIAISLKVNPSDKKIVEVNNTELGYVRVRSEPSTLGNEVGRASSGERFFVLEDAGNGYIKIDLGNGLTGWIAGWLTSQI